MLIHLKRRLTLLCGIATSVILTIVVIFVFFISYYQSEQHNTEIFNKNVNVIIDKIKTSNMISHDWINSIESENHLIIHIESLGHPLKYIGNTEETPINRNRLVEDVRKLALSEGMDLTLNPISSTIRMSSIFELNENDSEYYRGLEVIIPSNNGWQGLIIIQWIPDKTLNVIKHGLYYLIIDIIGCSMLFLLSYIFIGKAIKPVEENQQRQVEFIAAASHELRSPLTVIMAGISSLRNDIIQINNYLPNIESECRRMSKLINDMLLLASSDAKTWTLNKVLIDMDTFLIEAYDLFCPLARINNQKLSLDLTDEPLYNIKADKERLQQIITILIDNAMEYTPEDKSIIIRAYNYKKSINIEVIDQGPGISDEQKSLIFNRFYRGDKSRTSKKHFGLGLNIAKELIDLHQGNLCVKDTEGGGATFVVKLPTNS